MSKESKTKTQIREATNRIHIEGILKEIRLKEENDVISGDIIIMTGEHSEHAIRTYVTRLTKTEKVNAAYKGLQTVMTEYVSIASLLKEGRTLEEAQPLATKVRVTRGRLERNEFYTNDELVSRPAISSNFFNRVDDNSFEPKAEFELECYFERKRKETKDSEETGRLLVDVIIPIYGGAVIPMELVADGEIADYLEANYETKRTGNIWGSIVNIVERTATKKSGFGAAKEEVKVNYTRELVITGGTEEQYDEDSEKAYTTEQIKKAWKVRETETLPALLKKSKDSAKSSGSSDKKNTKANGFKF